jgi:hypothetical protein
MVLSGVKDPDQHPSEFAPTHANGNAASKDVNIVTTSLRPITTHSRKLTKFLGKLTDSSKTRSSPSTAM